jgi:hypothetical protein
MTYGPAVPEKDDGTFSLAEAGISRNLSSRAQRIADVPETEFEQAIDNALSAGI